MSPAPRHTWLYRLKYRVGRRGYFLLLLAVVDAIYGYRMLRPESPGQAEQNRYMAEVVTSLGERPSLFIWAGIWWSAGAMCLIYAFRRQDYPGFGAAFAMKVVWVSGNIAAGLGGMPGWQIRSVVWAFIATVVLVIANWPEPRNSFFEAMAEMEDTGEISRRPPGNKKDPTERADPDGPPDGAGR